MYLDWVIIASVITILVIVWGVAYSVIYMFNHISQDMQATKVSKANDQKAT